MRFLNTLNRDFLRRDYAEKLLFIGMEFVFGVFAAARGIRSVVNLSVPISLFLRDSHKAVLKMAKIYTLQRVPHAAPNSAPRSL